MAQAIIDRSCKKLKSVIIDTRDEAAKLGRTLGRAQLQKLDEMIAALDEIQPVLGDAEWMSVQFAQKWLTQVRHAGYDISDFVDGLQDTRVPASGTSQMIMLLPNNNSKIIVDKVNAVQQEVRKIHSELNRVKTPTTEVTEAALAILGRDGEKQRIMDVLSASNAPMMILPIFGLPAIGKTALARTIFDDTGLQDKYDHRVWVDVSGKVDLAKIRDSIISQVLPEGQEQNSLQELFNGKTVLVVLDDLWDEEPVQLKSLRSMLTFGHKVTVLVTTREKYIADKFWTVEPHVLDPLSDDACWTIIKQESRFQDKSPEEQEEMAQLGKEIAKKCGGVPVTAEVLGRLLRHKAVSGWQEVRHGATWYEFPAALELGYRRMTPYVRLCLAYCGIFPRGHCIAKDDLIHQWIALDLIEPSKERSATQLAGEYFEMLLGMSFLQPAKSDSTSGKNGERAILFTMHGLAHEFARYAMGEELIVLDSIMENKNCRYALLPNSDVGPLNLSGKLPPNIRSLYSVGCSKMELSGDSFSSATCLRVLAIVESSLQKLPDSVCQLRHLGHLNFSGCSGLVNLPEQFGTLTKLAYLNLSGCSSLRNLPKSFGDLTSLVHMDLSWCSGLENLPDFGKLLNLGHINLSGCFQLVKLPQSFADLVNLEHVSLARCYGLAKLSEPLKKLTKLVFLDLSFWSCFEVIEHLHCLTNLEHLNLSHPCCYTPIHQSDRHKLKDCLGKLTKLRYLNLSMLLNPIVFYMKDMKAGEYIESCIHGISSLEYLDLSHNTFLSDLPMSLGGLKKLHTLDLTGCIRLKKVPKEIAEIESLKSIFVRKCRGLHSYHFVVHSDDGPYSTSNFVQLEDVKHCEKLEISCLEKVKFTEEAQRTSLAEKHWVRKLKLCWTVGSEGYVQDTNGLLSELVPPYSLERLELHGYIGKTCFPTWLTSHTFSFNLLNIVEFKMEDSPSCSRLPPLGLLPNLRLVTIRKMASIRRINAGDLSGGNSAAFNQLSKLTIDDMESLEEFTTSYCRGGEEFVFPKIDELVLRKCPKLRLRSPKPRARNFDISDCHNVDVTST